MWFFVVHAFRKKARSSSAGKRLARVKGAIRAAAVLGFMLTIASLAAARHAKAELAATGMRIGKDLMPLVRELGDASTVALNGQRIMIKYSGSKTPVREVLDHAEAACREGGVTAPRVDVTAEKNPLLKLVDFGVMRTGDERQGLVLCFAKGSMSKGELQDQLKELEEHGNLGSLGKMRYVFARQDGEGTAVLAALTEDSFDMNALQPNPEGDSPGSDDPSLPRPRESVRFLTAVVEGTPYAVRGYRTRIAEDVVRAELDAQMLERGFTGVEIETKDGTKSNGYLRDGVVVVLGVAKDKTGETLVSFGSLGSDPRPQLR